MAEEEGPTDLPEGEEATYTDVQTSYDTAFDRLVADAFPEDQRGFMDLLGIGDASIAEEAFTQGEEYLYSVSPGGMGTFIETRLGDDLAALQERGGPEYDALVSRVAELKPSNADELLTVYKDIATPETYTAIVLAQAGVTEEGIEDFTQRLSQDEVVRERMDNLITRLEEDPNMSGDISSLMDRIEANGPLLRSIAANPDGFFEIARTDAFEPMMDTVATHLSNGGSLDRAGVADMIAGISLQDKAGLFMEIGGASAEEISQFQSNLDIALEANPELATVIDTAIMNSVTEATNSGATGNVFETLQSSAEMFSDYANSAYAQTLLQDPSMIEEIVTQAQAQGENLTLDSLQDVAIESVVYEEAGRYMALNGGNMSPGMMMFGGAGINMAIEQAQRMRDGESLERMQGIRSSFENLLSAVGLEGFTGGLGNAPGFLAEAAPTLAGRFGVEPTGFAAVTAAMDRNYIFDSIDYGQIGRNHANNVWDASGNVRPDSDRGRTMMENLTTDAPALIENATGYDVRGMLENAGVAAETLVSGQQPIVDALQQGADRAAEAFTPEEPADLESGGFTPFMPNGMGPR